MIDSIGVKNIIIFLSLINSVDLKTIIICSLNIIFWV